MKLKVSFRELPGGPEVVTQGFHCSKPGEGTKILKAAKVQLKINKLKKKKKIVSETQLLPHVIKRSRTGGKRAGGSEKSDPLGTENLTLMVGTQSL